MVEVDANLEHESGQQLLMGEGSRFRYIVVANRWSVEKQDAPSSDPMSYPTVFVA